MTGHDCFGEHTMAMVMQNGSDKEIKVRSIKEKQSGV